MQRFSVRYSVSGTITDIIEAENLDEANAIAESRADSNEFGTELDEVDDIDIYVQQLHKVIRDGRAILTTYVKPTDQLATDGTTN